MLLCFLVGLAWQPAEARIIEERTQSLKGGRWKAVQLVRNEDRPGAPLQRIETVHGRHGPKQRVAMLGDRLLVEALGSTGELESWFRELGLEMEGIYPFSPVFRVRLPDPRIVEYDRTLKRLKREAVRRNFRVSKDYLAWPALVPDDLYYDAQQDDLDLIGAPAAWDITTGSGETVVAIIDSGMDLDHPDLEANRFTNPLEIPGNGLDDDGNGLIDDVNGWDFWENDPVPTDTIGHGTKVAGIIGAIGNNSIGVAGTDWQCQLMPLKAGNSELPWSNIIQAIDYAIWMKGQGVRIAAVNNSYGGYIDDPIELAPLEAAVDRCALAGILFVAAAGNSGRDNDDPDDLYGPFYPSDLPNANILSVASTNNADLLSSFSNYGEISVDLAAPGASIYSTNTGGGYGYINGTSASCARVSGMAALLHAQNRNLGYAQMRDILIGSGVTLTSLVGKLAHPVRVDAAAALATARLFPQVSWLDGEAPLVVSEGQEWVLAAEASDFDGFVSSVSFFLDGALVATDSDGTDGWSWSWESPEGSGYLELLVLDSDDRDVRSWQRPYAVLSRFDYWRHGIWGKDFHEMPLADADADVDCDGMVNLWEYAVGGDPLIPFSAPERGGYPRLVRFTAAEGDYLGFDLRIRTSDPGLSLGLEQGTGLGPEEWTPVSPDFMESTSDPEDTDFDIIRMGMEIQVPPAQFMRVGIYLNN